MRRRVFLAATVALLALAGGGCGGTDDSTPAACLQSPRAYDRALASAPGRVTLDGVPLSDCLAENQQAGDLARVGAALLTEATALNAKARAEPGGDANLQLGYLLGSAQRGADSTNGIHTELIRRLSAAARYSPDNRPLTPLFLRTYREGFDAGHAMG